MAKTKQADAGEVKEALELQDAINADRTSERSQEAAAAVPAPDPAPEVAESGSGPQDGAGEIEDFKPAGTELVAMDARDAYRAMDRADEMQILEEIQGHALEEMVYSFEEGGKRLTDLSYAGVTETVRTMNSRGLTGIKIADTPPVVEEFTEDGQSYYRVTAYGTDSAHGGGQWGIATAPKRMKLKPATAAKWRNKGKEVRDDDTVWDSFALTKCLSKAQRNAMKPLIPMEIQKTVIAQYLGDSAKVKKIRSGPGAEALAELPPPLTDPKAEALKQEAREVYDSIKGHDRTALLPAAFHAYLTRAEHSHERLEEFVAYLRQRLGEVTPS